MEYFILLIFFIFFFIPISCNSTLNGTLESNSPYSVKIDEIQIAIFMEDYITIYKVTDSINEVIEPLDNLIPMDTNGQSCISDTEKGGIYFKGFYYTSCLKDKNENDENRLQIKVCPKDFSNCYTFPNETSYYNFSSLNTIKFFRARYSGEDLLFLCCLAIT